MTDAPTPRRRSCERWHVLELVIPAGCFFLLVSGFAGVSLMVNVIHGQQNLKEEHRVLLDKITHYCRVTK
jgi:hypothetical protein